MCRGAAYDPPTRWSDHSAAGEDGRIFFLVTGTMPNYCVVGWTRVEDARQDGYRWEYVWEGAPGRPERATVPVSRVVVIALTRDEQAYLIRLLEHELEEDDEPLVADLLKMVEDAVRPGFVASLVRR